MLKANELRIGNYISEKCKTIKADEDFLEVLFAARNYDSLDPIPLTPEILEKAGFKKNPIHHAEYFIETSKGKSFMVKLGYQFKHEGQWYPEIKYLHRLQNIYLDITEEELEIEL